VLNFINFHWPELLKLGFVVEFITPIIKARKGKETLSFYNLPEYEEWKSTTDTKGWTIKYYKGLGTSDREEAKAYFQDLKKHRVQFRFRGELDQKSFDLAFGKDKQDDRKEWINQADPKEFLSTESGSVTVSDFFNKYDAVCAVVCFFTLFFALIIALAQGDGSLQRGERAPRHSSCDGRIQAVAAQGAVRLLQAQPDQVHQSGPAGWVRFGEGGLPPRRAVSAGHHRRHGAELCGQQQHQLAAARGPVRITAHGRRRC
jgi:hypothetical protein